MNVAMRSYRVFGSGSAGHYSRINSPDGRVLTLTEAADEGLIQMGDPVDRGNNGFVGFADVEITPLVEGLTVTQHHWADPGPNDRPRTTPLLTTDTRRRPMQVKRRKRTARFAVVRLGFGELCSNGHPMPLKEVLDGIFSHDGWPSIEDLRNSITVWATVAEPGDVFCTKATAVIACK